MIYNIDFLVASLIFLLLILFHHKGQNRLHTANNRFFMLILLLAMSDVFLDILCTELIAANSRAATLTNTALTLFYLLQVSIPYVLFLYTRSLRLSIVKSRDIFFSIWSIPPAVLAILILVNFRTGVIFSFRNGEYLHGPYYMSMYYYALIYVGIIAIESIIYFSSLGMKKFTVIWEFLLVTGISVSVQACFNHMLMTGFGLTLGVTILFLTINNPHEFTDNLTGTLNSQYFLEWAQEQINHKKTFHILAVDLHPLKRINTIFGVNTGNQLLIQIAGKLLEINNDQNVFRITGKRFLMVTTSLSEYETVRNKLHDYFSTSFVTDKEQISLSSVICGILNGNTFKSSEDILSYIEYLIALAPDDQDTILVQDSERTLKGFQYEKEIELFLPTAIEQDLFEVYYQPVYSIKNNGYVTLEALSRLHHPKLGPISPELFITIAEKNGQIAQLGYLQFKRICRFIKENPQLMSRLQNIKINLSPAELLKSGHSTLLINTIKEYGLPFSFFQFEITETVATEYCENLFQAISEFRSAGIGLCLDDFGSGYANLNTVLKLPFSSIKLDRSLLNGIFETENVELFYSNIVSVLKNMGFYVIAEGIETKKEMERVSQWGVDMIQGYYFSRPLCSDDLLKLILKQ